MLWHFWYHNNNNTILEIFSIFELIMVDTWRFHWYNLLDWKKKTWLIKVLSFPFVQLELLHWNVSSIVTFSECHIMHWLHCELPHCAFLTCSKANGLIFYVWEQHTGACLWLTVNRGFENRREKSTERKVINILVSFIATAFFALFFCVVKVANPSILDNFNSMTLSPLMKTLYMNLQSIVDANPITNSIPNTVNFPIKCYMY